MVVAARATHRRARARPCRSSPPIRDILDAKFLIDDAALGARPMIAIEAVAIFWRRALGSRSPAICSIVN